MQIRKKQSHLLDYCLNAGNLHRLETGHKAPSTHPIIITLLLYITAVAQITCIKTFKT